MKQIKSEEKIEGFVIQFEDGRMFKVKTNWVKKIKTKIK